jgi:hypothetical protein
MLAQHAELAAELSLELAKLRVVDAARMELIRNATAGDMFPTVANVPLDDTPSRDRGLRVRCPHCNSPVEIVAKASLAEFVCGACGSSFSLVNVEAETHPHAPRRTIGRFELLQPLGSGAFGTVFKALDLKLNRLVAI